MNRDKESVALIDAAPRGGKATRFLCAIGVAAFSLVAESTRAETFVVDRWPDDVNMIPCSAWEKADDGTWVLIGRIKIGASETTNVGVKGDAAARAVEKKCGKK